MPYPAIPETKNLVDNPEFAADVQSMGTLLDTYMAATNDTVSMQRTHYLLSGLYPDILETGKSKQ